MDAYLKDQFDFTGVKAALLVEQSILVILRDNKPDIPWPNTWELPGGGREGQETPLECLQREVWEELGLTLKEESIIWSKIYPSMLDKDRSAVFVVGQISQEQYREIHFGDEGQEFKLMPVEDFIKAEGVVPFQAGPHIEIARNPNRPVLMHDVGKCRHRSALPRANALVLEPDVPLVVKIGKSLVAVEGGFIGRRYLPDHHRYRAVFALLDGQVGAGLAPLKKQFPALKICRAEDRSVRAAHPHLRDIEVAAISNVVSFFFHGIHPFRRGYPSTTLRPPKRSGVRWQEANSCVSFKRRPCRAGRLCPR